MFDSLQMAPPDAILGLTEAFNKDPSPDKINLGAGVYKDNAGKTPVLASVKEAEKRLLEAETSKSYKPISGDPAFARHVQQLLLGPNHSILAQKRAATVHCPGGTGALRVTADFLQRLLGVKTLWVSQPTWANHRSVFEAAGLQVDTYPYLDKATNGLAWDSMKSALTALPKGSVVLLHGCCHNPTGVDPTAEQWAELADLIADRALRPLVDFAYQGFGDGIEQDATGLRRLCDKVPEVIICSSFSKNFSLYNERTGAATFVAASAEQADVVMSNVKLCVRANYSNPPAHGAAIVATILDDPALRRQWEQELAEMRDRINGMRKQFVQTLEAKGAPIDCSFIERQRGMFSMSGLTKDQAVALREKHSVYIVDSGRLSVAGMTPANMDKLCSAIAAVS